METRFEQQLKKGVLEMVVLQLICQKPAYGYELILRLRAESGGLLTVKEGTLYPILYRLEDDGLIESAWQTPDDTSPPGQGRVMPKKIYTATPAGHAELTRQSAIWRQFAACIGSILTPEAAPAPATPEQEG